MSTCSVASVALVAPTSETLSLNRAAFLGLAGDWAEAVADFTEAAPVGILVSSLIAFGSAIGHGPHVRVGATVHRVNENAVLVGRTASGRKGEAMNAGLLPLRTGNARWAERVCRGFGSGEAVIAAVAPRPPEDDSQEAPVDPRLLVHEDELSGPLAIASRQGSTLSNILRTAWDGGRLESRTRGFGALVAPNPHVSVLAAITPEELVQRVSATDIANGFLNRFLIVKVSRSQLLPDGRAIPEKLIKQYAASFASSVEVGAQQRELRRDSDAADVWRHAYEHELSVDRFGLAGALCSRAEAHTLRLSMLYALLDRSRSGFVIRAEHVEAALALWRYCEQSAHLLFRDRTGTPYADAILTALRASPEGLTKTEIRDQFGRHHTAQVDVALRDLERAGLVERHKEATGGRSATRYVACDFRDDRSDQSDRNPSRRTAK